MSGFPLGVFRKEALPRPMRRFCPAWSADALSDVSPQMLARAGKKLVLLDVDNTLLPWRSEEVPEPTFAWFSQCRALGLELCILSNTRHPARLERLSQKLQAPFIRGRFKPNPAIYIQALNRFGRKPEEAVMIGDQIFTDIWGANRAGIEGIWVRPSTPRDFIGTKVSRLGERLLLPFFRNAMSPETSVDAALDRPVFWDRPVVKQFVKFAVVGGSSTVVDVGLHYVMMFVIRVDGVPLGQALGGWLIAQFPGAFSFAKDQPAAAVPVLKVVSASLAIVNSFIWNRRWTFRIVGKEERGHQFRKFVAVSVTGMVLNTLITTGLNNIIPGHALRSWGVATAVATVAVAFWNFTGQRMWAFRRKQA